MSPAFNDEIGLSEAKKSMDRLKRQLDSERGIVSPEFFYFDQAQKDSALRIQTQLETSKQVIESLEKNINELNTKIQGQQVPSKLFEEFQSLKESFEKIQSTSTQLSAPITLPNTKDLEVKLVAYNSLERLQEYNNEETIWFSLFGVFLGAILGVITNAVTGGQLSASTYVILGVYLICACIFFTAAFYKRKKSSEIKKRI